MWENIFKSAVKFTKNEDVSSFLRSLEHQSAIVLLNIRIYEGVIEGTNYLTNCLIIRGGSFMTAKIKEMNISLSD
jgi:hypothetical protein